MLYWIIGIILIYYIINFEGVPEFKIKKYWALLDYCGDFFCTSDGRVYVKGNVVYMDFIPVFTFNPTDVSEIVFLTSLKSVLQMTERSLANEYQRQKKK